MYVCLCNQVTDKQIRRAVAKGATFNELQQELGLSAQCGSCEGVARQIVNETHQADSSEPVLWYAAI